MNEKITSEQKQPTGATAVSSDKAIKEPAKNEPVSALERQQDKESKKQKRKAALSGRIIELDILRGIAVLFMIFDHVMYDIGYIMPMVFDGFTRTNDVVQFARNYWSWDVRLGFRYFIVAIFLVLTGVCCSLSKSNLKRGVKLLDVAFMLTLVTYAIGLVLDNVNFTITFGVLHCIALALIFVGIHEKFGTNKWSYLIIGLVMLCLGIIIENIGPTRMSYNNNDFFDLLIKQMIGLVECGQDSFAFFLNGGQIYLGVFLGKLLYGQKKSLFTKIPKLQNMKYHNNVVTFLGRNSLLAYFASQIIFPLLIGIVLLMCGYTLAF